MRLPDDSERCIAFFPEAGLLAKSDSDVFCKTKGGRSPIMPLLANASTKKAYNKGNFLYIYIYIYIYIYKK